MKTSELTGAALDWAVAKCEGHTGKWVDDDLFGNHIERPYSPSTDWAQGGPIIEREFIEFGVSKTDPIRYAAKIYVNDKRIITHGSTHLIAAMRCYVASKLGDDVEVPPELM